MKATGIVRSIDDLGRIVVPKEVRRIFDIKEGDALEIYTDKDGIYFKKYIEPEFDCVLCNNPTSNYILNKYICLDCIEKIKSEVI